MRLVLVERQQGLRERLDRLDQAFVFEQSIDRKSYERQRNLIRDELASAAFDSADCSEPTGGLQEVLAFAGYFVSNVSRIWAEAPSAEKRELQAAVVPTGIDWDGATFGTALTSPIFNLLAGVSEGSNEVASPSGIVPEGQGVKRRRPSA